LAVKGIQKLSRLLDCGSLFIVIGPPRLHARDEDASPGESMFKIMNVTRELEGFLSNILKTGAALV
jgi:hypothetical protein